MAESFDASNQSLMFGGKEFPFNPNNTSYDSESSLAEHSQSLMIDKIDHPSFHKDESPLVEERDPASV